MGNDVHWFIIKEGTCCRDERVRRGKGGRGRAPGCGQSGAPSRWASGSRVGRRAAQPSRRASRVHLEAGVRPEPPLARPGCWAVAASRHRLGSSHTAGLTAQLLEAGHPPTGRRGEGGSQRGTPPPPLEGGLPAESSWREGPGRSLGCLLIEALLSSQGLHLVASSPPKAHPQHCHLGVRGFDMPIWGKGTQSDHSSDLRRS